MEFNYQTRKQRRQAILDALMGDTGIWIDLLVVNSSSEENCGNYALLHGNYSPPAYDANGNSFGESWDSHTIIGTDEGFPNGFQTLADVSRFLSEELARLFVMKADALCNPNFVTSDEGISYERIEVMLRAWQLFQDKFEDAMQRGLLVDVDAANTAYKKLMN